ncbi:CBK_G0011390.mRNA.1.CDS.1 [Saccharomyces cerevisiae]|nr:CBK_G0011390.mRNA.1.CDS.1 [Saccharomyces cerevisiae]CAI7214778.1 CBK_G0011390.mRNA.1.CDS.1 [Saccharomyces cerevisiae]
MDADASRGSVRNVSTRRNSASRMPLTQKTELLKTIKGRLIYWRKCWQLSIKFMSVDNYTALLALDTYEIKFS